ncbi:hypothetical protein RND71_025263 [Anisodus tanguticus]|uniref:Uncharacterized protein n=1 Tax=Anisodus tanguticus TaxID=243964 RepID=A0AAE1RRY8_9SOLA|nr:hypothetical protein RND71_025263 [Anisodus tanguticus]
MTRSNTTPSVATEIPAHHDTGNWFSCPAPNTTPSMAPQMPSTVAGRSSRTRSGIGRERGVGRDVNYPLESWFTCSNSAAAPNSAAVSGSQSGPSSATANKEKGKDSPFFAPKGVISHPRSPHTPVRQVCEGGKSW